MPCECLEVITATNYPASDATSDLQTYRANHQEVLSTQATELRTVTEQSEGPVTNHYYGRFRFSIDMALTTLRDDLEAWLGNNFDWWAWRHHTCAHDPQTGTHESGSSCPAPGAWPNSNTSGNVPSDVLNIYI